MFFILSKTLSYLTTPLFIITFLFIISLVLHPSNKWKGRYFKIALTLLLFFSNDFIVNEIVTAWEIPPTPYTSLKKKYTYGIILTGVTKSEAETTDRVYFNRGADRVTHALQLYKLGYIKKIIVSGGNGSLHKVDKQEADQISDVLLLSGVQQRDIYLENISRNTRESAIQINKLYGGIVPPSQCLLITSGYHMRRSLACFLKQGWKIDPFSTDFISHPRRFDLDILLIPKVNALEHWSILVREWVGMITYMISGYI